MSEALFVISVGAFAAVTYCAAHSTMLWWYRRRARRRFERMARPWWVSDKEDHER